MDIMEWASANIPFILMALIGVLAASALLKGAMKVTFIVLFVIMIVSRFVPF